MRTILRKNKRPKRTALVTDRLWKSIKRAARDRGSHWVAVPYVSQGAARRFPLRKGDVLITRFDDRTISSGQTDPREILKYLRRGVEVHNCVELHAKVYVSALRAVVASANLSRNSEEWLKEAGTESLEPKLLSAARSFVESLRGEIIGVDFAKKKVALYKPPKGQGGGKQIKPARAALWVVNVEVDENLSGEDKAAAEWAGDTAKAKLRDVKRFQIVRIRYPGDWTVKEGDYVVRYFSGGRDASLEAPARANTIHRYVRHGRAQLMVIMEERRRLRTRTPMQLRRWLRARGATLRLPQTFRKVRNAAARRALFQLWPGVEEVTRK
jgi:hypothetical protein